jgi:hypothetical protein
MALVEMAVRTRLYVDHVDAFLLEQRSLVDRRKKAILPILRERTSLVELLSRLLSQLGLDRVAVESLTESGYSRGAGCMRFVTRTQLCRSPPVSHLRRHLAKGWDQTMRNISLIQIYGKLARWTKRRGHLTLSANASGQMCSSLLPSPHPIVATQRLAPLGRRRCRR